MSKKITFEFIKEEYIKGEVCMGELLASLSADGLTLEEAAELYFECKNWSGDCDDREGQVIISELNSIELKREETYAVFDINTVFSTEEHSLFYSSIDGEITGIDSDSIKKNFPNLTNYLIDYPDNHCGDVYKIEVTDPIRLIEDLITSEELSELTEEFIDSEKNKDVKMRCCYSDTFGVFNYKEIERESKFECKDEDSFCSTYNAFLLKNFEGKVSIYEVISNLGSKWKIIVGKDNSIESNNFLLLMDDYYLYRD